MKFVTISFIFFFVIPFAFADLRVGFYRSSCPGAETIVHQVVQRFFNQKESITAGLLRLHFHDCFVRGCDASILIDPNPRNGNESEKQAGPNLTVRGYEIIDEAKESLENECPETVSCADIITLATRDAVGLAGGPKYEVPTGRRDGFISKFSDVQLPGPDLSVLQAFQFFRSKGMTMEEMVVLLGAHTIGFAKCSFIRNRLKNDPSMDPVLRNRLIRFCNSQGNPDVFLDQGTNFVFDNDFYRQLRVMKGVLFIDQQLALDSASSGFVSNFAENNVRFFDSFVKAMIKMGNIGVLENKEGEIRRNCRLVNS